MLKKIILILIFIALLVACNNQGNERSTTLEDNSSTEESLENTGEIPVDYELDKIVFSRGFQSTDPNVELIKEGQTLTLLVTAGLIESSEVKIDKITRENNIINIYISKEMEGDKVQLAVPQITALIDSSIFQNPDSLKFNIISQNYDTISLKFNKNQILNKVYSKYKIEPNTIPEVELVKSDDDIIWKIYFTNIFNKEDMKAPLFNLSVYVDAISGELLDSDQYTTSTYIAEGQILSFLPNKALVYKQEKLIDNVPYQDLWCYNLETNEKTKLYTTKSKITSASISPDGEHISLIENDEYHSDIYLIKMSNKTAYKITPINYVHPQLIQWKNNEEIYFMDIDHDLSLLFVYNIAENESHKKFQIEKPVSSFNVLDDSIVFTESDDLSLNKNIYITNDGKNLIKIGNGFRPTFINSNRIAYLENMEKENKNILNIYKPESNEHIGFSDYDIVNYYKIDDENLLLIAKTDSSNQFKLIKYNLINESTLYLSKINSDNVFFNVNENSAYITLTTPIDKEKSIHNIYCLNLNEMSSTKN